MFERIKNLAFIITTFASLSPIVLAQETSDNSLDRTWGIPERPKTCANSEQYLFDVRRMLEKQSNPNTVLIIIARLGNGEKSREINRRRLDNVSEYMKNAYGVEPKKIIIAQGEKTNGFGRIEFYLAGQMVGALLVNRNRDFFVNCYDYGEEYYPQKDEVDRKNKDKNRNKRRG